MTLDGFEEGLGAADLRSGFVASSSGLGVSCSVVIAVFEGYRQGTDVAMARVCAERPGPVENLWDTCFGPLD